MIPAGKGMYYKHKRGKDLGCGALFEPHASALGTVLIEGVDVYPVDTLGRLAAPFPNYHSMKPWRITIRRAYGSLTFSANFKLAGAQNPCQ